MSLPERENVRGHDWLLVPLIPVELRDVERIAKRQRFVLRRLDLFGGEVRGAAVYCARCEIPYERMTPTERERCRG